jgi:DNA-binding LacI/PurR family transcriptional regulator
LVRQSTASYTQDAIRGAREWSRRHKRSIRVFQVREMSIASVESALATQLCYRTRPDCIYAPDELGAIGALHAARAAALEVPRELGIICGLDGPLLQDTSPPISAIDIHPELVGRHSVERLFRMTSSDVAVREGPLVPFTLRARASTSRLS